MYPNLTDNKPNAISELRPTSQQNKGKTTLAVFTLLAALSATPLLAADAETAGPDHSTITPYPSDPRVESNGGNQVVQMPIAFPASYSTEATLTPLNGKDAFEVVVRISQLVEVKGKLTEKIISQPKLVSELGVPASIYLGPEPTSRNYLGADNITVDVSWSKTGQTSVASCVVTIKRGDKPVWKSKMQMTIADETQVANDPSAMPGHDIDFVGAKPTLKLGGAIPKHKQQLSAGGIPAVPTLDERLLHADLSRALKHYEQVKLMAYETELQLALTSGGTDSADKERSALDKRLLVLRQKVDELRARAFECDKQLQNLRGGGLPAGQELPAEQVYK